MIDSRDPHVPSVRAVVSFQSHLDTIKAAWPAEERFSALNNLFQGDTGQSVDAWRFAEAYVTLDRPDREAFDSFFFAESSAVFKPILQSILLLNQCGLLSQKNFECVQLLLEELGSDFYGSIAALENNPLLMQSCFRYLADHPAKKDVLFAIYPLIKELQRRNLFDSLTFSLIMAHGGRSPARLLQIITSLNTLNARLFRVLIEIEDERRLENVAKAFSYLEDPNRNYNDINNTKPFSPEIYEYVALHEKLDVLKTALSVLAFRGNILTPDLLQKLIMLPKQSLFFDENSQGFWNRYDGSVGILSPKLESELINRWHIFQKKLSTVEQDRYSTLLSYQMFEDRIDDYKQNEYRNQGLIRTAINYAAPGPLVDFFNLLEPITVWGFAQAYARSEALAKDARWPFANVENRQQKQAIENILSSIQLLYNINQAIPPAVMGVLDYVFTQANVEFAIAQEQYQFGAVLVALNEARLLTGKYLCLIRAYVLDRLDHNQQDNSVLFNILRVLHEQTILNGQTFILTITSFHEALESVYNYINLMGVQYLDQPLFTTLLQHASVLSHANNFVRLAQIGIENYAELIACFISHPRRVVINSLIALLENNGLLSERNLQLSERNLQRLVLLPGQPFFSDASEHLVLVSNQDAFNGKCQEIEDSALAEVPSIVVLEEPGEMVLPENYYDQTPIGSACLVGVGMYPRSNNNDGDKKPSAAPAPNGG